MNITELAERVATKQSLDKGQTRKVIEAALQAVVEAAKNGDEVSLPAFGKFKVQDRPEREGRHPATGEAITLAPNRKLAFSPAKAVKDALNG
jgi:DNA-binding protein HU-beta